MSDARTAIVGVLGTGTMGPQSAVALASSGLQVVMLGRLPSDQITSKLRLALRLHTRRLGSEAPPQRLSLFPVFSSGSRPRPSGRCVSNAKTWTQVFQLIDTVGAQGYEFPAINRLVDDLVKLSLP